MKYAIATYHRKEQKTVELLLEKGVEPKDILIATQDESDFNYLNNKYPDIPIICDTSVHNISGNRNQIIRHLKSIGEEYAFVMDDDIIMFDTDGKTMKEVSNDCQQFMKQHKITIMNIGHKKIDNPYYINTLINWFWDGQCSVLDVKNSLFFDEKYDVCEDTAMGFEVLEQNKRTAYTTRYICQANPWGQVSKTEGGCADAYKEGKFEICRHMLAKDYPRYYMEIPMDVPNKRDYIIFHHPTEIINWQ